MTTNVSCQDSQTQSALTHAVLVYSSGGQTTMATVHDVDIDDDKPVIKAGKLITTDALKSLFETLKPKQMNVTALLPQNVLATGEEFVVWFTPPQEKALWFKCAQIGGEVSGTVSLPGLVFFVSATGSWHVFSFKGNDRPNSTTKLFNSPFMNVWEGGKLCEGNVVRPKQLSAFNTGEWEDIFFRSRFTHTNQNHAKIIKYKPDAYAFWKDLLAKKWKKFPESMLVPSGVTLAEQFDIFAGLGGKDE